MVRSEIDDDVPPLVAEFDSEFKPKHLHNDAPQPAEAEAQAVKKDEEVTEEAANPPTSLMEEAANPSTAHKQNDSEDAIALQKTRMLKFLFPDDAPSRAVCFFSFLANYLKLISFF